MLPLSLSEETRCNLRHRFDHLKGPPQMSTPPSELGITGDSWACLRTARFYFCFLFHSPHHVPLALFLQKRSKDRTLSSKPFIYQEGMWARITYSVPSFLSLFFFFLSCKNLHWGKNPKQSWIAVKSFTWSGRASTVLLVGFVSWYMIQTSYRI